MEKKMMQNDIKLGYTCAAMSGVGGLKRATRKCFSDTSPSYHENRLRQPNRNLATMTFDLQG